MPLCSNVFMDVDGPEPAIDAIPLKRDVTKKGSFWSGFTNKTIDVLLAFAKHSTLTKLVA